MKRLDLLIAMGVGMIASSAIILATDHPVPDTVAHAGKVARSTRLTWDNYGQPPAAGAWTCLLEGSTNGRTWYRITNCPWSPRVQIEIGTRPLCETYRARVIQ